MKGHIAGVQSAHLPSLSQHSLTVIARSAWAQLVRWHELHRQRQQLARLSDALLKDIGRSRADVEAEISKPFWDDPLNQR